MSDRPPEPPGQTVPCPHCARAIPAECLFCPHCDQPICRAPSSRNGFADELRELSLGPVGAVFAFCILCVVLVVGVVLLGGY